MRELFFLLFALVILGAPSFILCDYQPPEEDQKEQLYNVFAFEQMHLLQDVNIDKPANKIILPDRKLKSKATNIPKGMNTPAYKNMHQRVKEKIHLHNKEARERHIDKTMNDWDLLFGLSDRTELK